MSSATAANAHQRHFTGQGGKIDIYSSGDEAAKYLHEALAYLLLPSMGRRSGEAMAAGDLEAGKPEMSTCRNCIGNPLYLPQWPNVKGERWVPTCVKSIF